jgi:hypothetical protein
VKTNPSEYLLCDIPAQTNNPIDCSCSQDKNLTKDTDSTTVGIELNEEKAINTKINAEVIVQINPKIPLFIYLFIG